MSRAGILAAIIVFAFFAFVAQATPAQRILTHTYGSGSQAIVITLMYVLPDGPVHIATSSPLAHPRRSVSPAEFEQMWNALLASGAKKLQSSGPAKTIDGAHNYYFSLGEVPSGRSHKFVVPKELLVPTKDASPVVAAVARQIRGLL
jgi:3-hydroxy-3-methylglutaryl CoA synthase